MNQIGLTCTPLPVNAEAHRFMPNGKYLRTGHRPAPVNEHDPILSPVCRPAEYAWSQSGASAAQAVSVRDRGRAPAAGPQRVAGLVRHLR